MSEQDGSEIDSEFGIGDLVFDREREREPNNPAVVMNMPPVTADDWDAYADKTVADDNPTYPPDAAVIVVAFQHEIADTQPELLTADDPIPIHDLNEAGISHYSFPAPRLRHADPETDDVDNGTGMTAETDDGTDDRKEPDRTSTAEPPAESMKSTEPPATEQETNTATAPGTGKQQELQHLKEHLLDNGIRSEIDEETETLTIEKLGESYRLAPGEVIEGDGAYRDRLEALVTDAST